MKKRFLTFPLFLLTALFLTLSTSSAEKLASGRMEIANRSDTDGVLSCDVTLTGERIKGSLFAAVFAESEQMKRVSVYPAEETVRISLSDVAATDYIKIMWLDEKYAPMVSPVILRMSGNGSSAYAKFAEDFLKLQEEYGGNGGGAASGSDDPYILARLLVSCNPLPDLSDYNVVAMIEGPNDLYVLQFNTAGEAKECAEYLRTFPFVRYAEPDSIAQADSAESSAAAPLSWGAEVTGLAEYAKNLRDRGINNSMVVAVVDSGVALEHDFLEGRLISGYDFIDGDDVPQDGFGHGTHIAGIIADCTPEMNVKIMPVRVLDNGGTGSASYISAGIRYAADHGANIINLSLGLALGHSSYVEEAVAYAISKNITVVVAAGNQNTDVKGRCPAHIEDCITVSAADRNWKRFELSNYGEAVDIAAPGVAIYSSIPDDKYAEMSGTSMAAPHVTAAAALLMEERGTAQTPAQISRALRDSAASLDVSGQMSAAGNVYFGAGFLNLTPFIIYPQHTIAFYANGGEGSMTPQSAADGSLTTLKANAFFREGYDFVNWNTKADGSGDTYADGVTLTVNQNLSLYAQWKPESVLYALLYTDGELVFQNGNTPNPSKTLTQSYAIPARGAVGEYAKWYDRRADIQTVTFAEPVRPLSTNLWFYGCENLTEIRGLENLDLSAVTNMSQMFARCTSLKTLDLSALDTKNVTDMRQMFFQCASLGKIYASGAFDVSNVENSDDMFTGCVSLPNYDPAHTDKEYARIDNPPDAPGYYAPTAYTVTWSDVTGCTIRVYRESEESEPLSKGATVYQGDRLRVSYQAQEGYRITDKGPESITVEGDVTESSIWAIASVKSYTCTIQHNSESGAQLGSVSLTRPFGTKETYAPPDYAGYKTPASRVIEWTKDQTVTFTYARNSYTYTVKYVSDHGVPLGSVALTRPFETKKTHTPPNYAGYQTPSAREIAWNTPDAQTITFTYSVSSVSYAYQSGRICDEPVITFGAEIQYRNRTADSVQIRVVWTDTIQAYGYDAYSQNLNVSVNGIGAGLVTVAGFNLWGGSSSYERSSTGETDWITVPIGAQTTSVSVSAYHYQANYYGTDMVAYGVTPYNGTWTVSIPAY